MEDDKTDSGSTDSTQTQTTGETQISEEVLQQFVESLKDDLNTYKKSVDPLRVKTRL